MRVVYLSFLLWAARADSILPPSLDCSKSAHTVEVEAAGTDIFYCPEFFSNATCCPREQMENVWAKIEDIMQFITRVLGDHTQQLGDISSMGPLDGGTCGDYHSNLFNTRAKSYERAREVVEKGTEVLQGAALQLLCRACFTCSRKGKAIQIEEFIRDALGSIVNAMQAIQAEQRVADLPPHSECAFTYVTSLADGVPFPPWARFVPQMSLSSDSTLYGTFAEWMDRVLSVLLETPSVLVYQLNLLQLAFFYGERPESDAYWMLHGPMPNSDGKQMGLVDSSTNFSDSCPPGPRRLLVLVPKSAEAENLPKWRAALEQLAPAWVAAWVVTYPRHVRALLRDAGLAPERSADPEGQAKLERSYLVWRRFHATQPDAVAAALCPNKHVWVLELSKVVDTAFEKSATSFQSLAETPMLDHLEQPAWPNGFRPARSLHDESEWPTLAVVEYLRAHAEFRAALAAGKQLPESKVLVYTCTSMTLCGGHGDRLNGMLGAAVIAFITGRFFFIDSQRPVPLALVLQPAAFDWRLSGTLGGMPASFNMNDKLAAFEADPLRILDNQDRVVRLVSNQRLAAAAVHAKPQQAAALGFLPRRKLHAQLFQTLFKPSFALQRRLDLRQLPEGRLIGIHFRAGDQMPQHWTDPPRHALDELEEFLDCAGRIEAAFNWNARIVLFADTDLVLKMPRVKQMQESGKLVWPAETDSLIHLDRSPPMLTVRGLSKVWAEWWTLAFDVDALVLCQSGFGATALEIGQDRPAFLGKGCIRADGSTG